MIRLRHLGWSGLAVEVDGEPVLTTRGSAAGTLANLSASGGGPRPGEPRSGEPGGASAASDADKRRADPGGCARIGDRILVDPPEPPAPEVGDPVVVTWTEQERCRGARGSAGPLAAAPEVLRWLGREGRALVPGGVRLGAFTLYARPFTPIPYATPPEALRKARSALRDPWLAVERLRSTLGRPASAPRVLRLDHPAGRVLVAGQALHRFVSEAEAAALLAWAGEVDLVVAGPDYDDEAACGALLGRFRAHTFVVADLTGPVRRHLGLPVRPLGLTLAAAPPGALELREGGELEARPFPRR